MAASQDEQDVISCMLKLPIEVNPSEDEGEDVDESNNRQQSEEPREGVNGPQGPQPLDEAEATSEFSHELSDEQTYYDVFISVGIRQALPVMNPYICIWCTGNKEDDTINGLCDSCKSRMRKDEEEQELFDKAIDVFNFTIASRRVRFYDKIEHILDEHGESRFLIYKGDHNKARVQVPGLDFVILNEAGVQTEYTLSEAQQELLMQCLLTSRQCHCQMIFLPDLLNQEFHGSPMEDLDLPPGHGDVASEASRLVDSIREVFFTPKHETCGSHYIYKFEMSRSKRQYAVSFSDKQLGWPQIVRPWEEYYHERIEDVTGTRNDVNDLGDKREVTERCVETDLERVREEDPFSDEYFKHLEMQMYLDDSQWITDDWKKWKENGKL
ncbi:hypothetical protein SLS60_010050 [Paraconiothyrium brasiliense]|uniref:Uncharacterized protein n=1 Tax=Paraconiothyrium brasiliense TaxID=300254 RepID=A0ABR3QQ64_9PLEO